VNEYVKTNLDTYLINVDKNKDKEKLSYKQWEQLLLEYCNENKYVPQHKTIYKGHQIGRWFQAQKSKIKNIDDDLYKKLSINEHLKKSIDDYMSPDNKWNEWLQLLFEYCNEHECTPPCKTSYKEQKIGQWFQFQKRKIKNIDDDLYKKLEENKYVKENLDEYLTNVEKNKKKEKLSWIQWAILLFQYCDENECVPPKRTIYEGQNIRAWLQNQKVKIKSIDDDLYIKLSENEYVKENLDTYLRSKKSVVPKNSIRDSDDDTESDQSSEEEKIVKVVKKQPVKKPPVKSTKKVVIRRAIPK